MDNLILILAISSPFLLLLVLLLMQGRNRRKKEAGLIKSGQISLLPFWATIKASYQLTWKYREEYVKIAWCWLILAVPVMFVYAWLDWPSTKILVCFDGSQPLPELGVGDLKTSMLSLLRDIIMLFFGVSTAVAWHRLILGDERVVSNCYLRFDKLVWNYFLLGFLILLVEQLPDWLRLLGDEEMVLISYLISLMLLVFVVPFTIFLTILLPARALAIKGVTIRDALKKTRNNFWRLTFGQLLCGLPLGLTMAVFLWVLRLGCGSNITGPMIYAVYLLIVLFVSPPVYLSFLSLSYRHFFEKEGANVASETH